MNLRVLAASGEPIRINPGAIPQSGTRPYQEKKWTFFNLRNLRNLRML